MADHAPFRAILDEQERAWAAGDADGIARDVTDDVVFTNVVGMFAVGRAGFVGQHVHIFATFYRGTVLRQHIEHLAFVRADVAIVNSHTQVTGFGEMPAAFPALDGVLHTRLEQVMVRDAGRWRVAAFHNTVVSPQAASALPPDRPPIS
ncbi:SgcJ/EcaC family oxidoreductase [Sphingomonas bacterium]|uniref:SgcJ/EcaC family oxidoreductase n=1 Tax=Sphingomonas bacterium TaxID=1895847 RepID=UPI0015773482|nr:SgcJ/EcaC family oxidoreductase [Sphingomonas bacterium]